MITAIIPAHNESKIISQTIFQLQKQVDRIVVACDNCTDNTFSIARGLGCIAFNTVNNTGRKAGALNQALKNYIDFSDLSQHILICDADTKIVDDWIDRAEREMNNRKIGAVGSVFMADNKRGILRYCQYMEWNRYTNQIRRAKKVFVLTGTASLIKASALLDVFRKNDGFFYNEKSITEDFTMTLDLKESGWNLISPLSCIAYTETMPKWRDLYLQRKRWYLGALQQITSRKWTKKMIPYVFQQFMLQISILSLFTLILFSIYLLIVDGLSASPFWLAVGLVFIFERVITAKGSGAQGAFIAAIMIPELIYSIWLQVSYIGALFDLIRKSSGTWHHI